MTKKANYTVWNKQPLMFVKNSSCLHTSVLYKKKVHLNYSSFMLIVLCSTWETPLKSKNWNIFFTINRRFIEILHTCYLWLLLLQSMDIYFHFYGVASLNKLQKNKIYYLIWNWEHLLSCKFPLLVPVFKPSLTCVVLCEDNFILNFSKNVFLIEDVLLQNCTMLQTTHNS